MVEPSDDPLALAPGDWHRLTTLRDGTRVLLRQIRPADRHRLVEGLARLSPASRYLRFHASIDRLSEEQLDVLTQVDHHDHEAIVAVDLDRLDRPGVGVARFIREPYEPRVAEAAITVADEYQGLGVGTVLLGALAARAREEDVEVFRSYVLHGNQGMLEVFDHLGAHRERETDGLWRVDLAVPDSEGATVPSTPAGRAFLSQALEEHRLASIMPPIWSRLLRRPRRDPAGRQPEPPEEASGEAEDDPTGIEEFTEMSTELDAWLQRREER